MKFTFNQKTKKAFTLVELLVALGIFSMVAVIAVGSLFSAQNLNTKIQQTHIILDGMNFSMETMVRDLRYGAIFHCGATYDESGASTRKSCPFTSFSSIPGSAIIFRGASSAIATDRVAYYLSNNHIFKWDSVSNTSIPVTSDDVVIESLHFFVSGTLSSDNEQPAITIIIAGVTKPPKANITPVKFRLQTTTSARRIDN